MQFQTIKITPTVAAQMLLNNTHNRVLRTATVKYYAEEMLAGRWIEETAEAIKIATTGRILDGQHRLEAIILSGITLNMQVVTGLDESIFSVLDTGLGRTASDVFNICSIKNYSIIPAMILCHYNIKTVKKTLKVHKKHNSLELLQIYQNNQLFWDDVAKKTRVWYLNFSKLLQPSILGGLYATFLEINESDAVNFFTELCTGMNVTNNTIFQLRNILMRDKLSSLKLTPQYKNALIIKTWNYYRENKEVARLTFRANRDEFPLPI